ncbi:thiol:disulfide interchange protein DsbG [Ideonella oryzae]|uniref:Thiol:disulfide interchange protein n=1 Tax=Ideonella oryzae TaxID=2937441 RepID=A0ABT1BQB1_9BURK|nr:thiol:disulfide interchange protein DsbG [Ideonella oryzae]MCO5978094.1 thiol:disulfide interchange protein DsbG [Ideonella oryzae]
MTTHRLPTPALSGALTRRALLALAAIASASPASGLAATASADQLLPLLQNSSWIADGSIGARRVVYVFTDPNCPYCNKFWADARPWVQAGKVQLRHVIVGILTPESPGKAAALLGAPNPAAALASYEAGQVEATARALASGHPHPLSNQGLRPLAVVPAALGARLEANARLMQALGLQATPAVVWRDENGALQARTGVTPRTLNEAMGPR